MSTPNPSAAPNPSEYAGDEVSAIVLDPGYSTTRAGFAGEDVPKSVVPSFYGVLDSGSGPRYVYGENAIHNPLAGLEIKNPWSSDGIVEDWEAASKVWEYAITSRLTGAKPTDPRKNGLNDPSGEDMDVDMEGLEDNEKPLSDSPLLMTEPGWNSAKAREKYIEIAMEEWGTPAFYLAKTGVLAAFAAGKASGLVIDIGASMTSVTPVLDGMVLKKGVQKSSLAGNFVSNQLRLIFEQSQPKIPLTPHYMVTSKTAVDAGAPAQAVYRQFATPPGDSFRRLEEERVLTEFKESVVEIWNGPPGQHRFSQNEDSARSLPGRPFEMPDGWNQVFGVERFKAAEGLFDAAAAFTDEQHPRPKEEQTIPKLIQAAISSVDADQRTMLQNHIVVTGGSSLLYKITDRLGAEINALFPSTRNKLHAPGQVVERKYAAWIGGSILASLGSFHQLWISKKEYEEHGVNIVEKRCK
ncbi:Actin/actin-like protein [Delitschia confertaspora ATCC 74209]|uniref:Actin/actin-like protein n=1 Tax=Delitschia confertaspora ATCC 74209 TaxID=1513339 RepID=A0A9P4JMM5_9PLEO|nr:Actin/actin-like protein [Delitschia confertaspora ATCC 74209]